MGKRDDDHPADKALERLVASIEPRKAPAHLSGWRRAVWSMADWTDRNRYLVAAFIVGAPFAALTMLAYSHGYSGWGAMLGDWLNRAA